MDRSNKNLKSIYIFYLTYCFFTQSTEQNNFSSLSKGTPVKAFEQKLHLLAYTEFNDFLTHKKIKKLAATRPITYKCREGLYSK
jgi:hypothetical protein